MESAVNIDKAAQRAFGQEPTPTSKEHTGELQL